MSQHKPDIPPNSAYVDPNLVLRGPAWVEEALEAVVGMWRDRADIDPVAWQRQLRAEWEQRSTSRPT
jgi:hypothetical protein